MLFVIILYKNRKCYIYLKHGIIPFPTHKEEYNLSITSNLSTNRRLIVTSKYYTHTHTRGLPRVNYSSLPDTHRYARRQPGARANAHSNARSHSYTRRYARTYSTYVDMYTCWCRVENRWDVSGSSCP